MYLSMLLPQKKAFIMMLFITALLVLRYQNDKSDARMVRVSKGSSTDLHSHDFRPLKCSGTCPNEDKYILPSFVIAGTMKGGTSALREFLVQHPMVASNQHKEIHLLDKLDEHGIIKTPNDKKLNRCRVMEAYDSIFRKMQAKSADKDNNKKIFFDKSPAYLLDSHVLPQRLLCVLPNTKAIVILRNPVDRAYSQHQHRMRKEGAPEKSFEHVVESNIEHLTQSGLLDTNITSQEEHDRWAEHERKHGPIQRGLYAIQLKQWIAVFKDHFGDPGWKQHLLIIESEAMRKDTQMYFNRILDFVGLPPHMLPPQQPSVHQYVDQYEPMRNDTRSKLEEWFHPHNQKLQQLLTHEKLGIDISWATK